MEFKNIPVASPEAISHTIHTDPLVSRWFEFLVTRPELQHHWTADSISSQAYQKLQKLRIPESITIGLMITLILFAIWRPTPLFLGGLILLWPYQIIKDRKTQQIIALSLPLIKKDFPAEELTFTSLLQIGEFYSNKYNIPSFADTVYHFDRISRWVLLTTILFSWLILAHPLYMQILCAFVAQFLTYQLLRTEPIYKNLR